MNFENVRLVHAKNLPDNRALGLFASSVNGCDTASADALRVSVMHLADGPLSDQQIRQFVHPDNQMWIESGSQFCLRGVYGTVSATITRDEDGVFVLEVLGPLDEVVASIRGPEKPDEKAWQISGCGEFLSVNDLYASLRAV